MLPIEIEVLDSVKGVCSEYSAALSCKKISLGLPEIKVWKRGELYSSEISVVVTKDEEFEDSLEFFVFRDGKIQVKGNEVVEWMELQIKEILQRHSHS